MKTTILPLPVFVASKPPANPKILGRVAILSTPLINPSSALVAVIIPSEFAKFCTKAVHEFESLFRLPYFIQQSSLYFASYNYEIN